MDEIFSMRRQVQFAETDLAGVMHFSNYFRWMEEVEHAWWRSLGLSVQTVADPVGSIGWPRVSVQCEYSAPLRFEDVVELRHRVVSVGEKSLTHEVEFVLNGRRVALGRMVAACCAMTPAGFRAVAVPPEILAHVARWKTQ